MHKGEAAERRRAEQAGEEGEERLQQTSAEIDAQVKQIKIDCRLELHSTITVNLSSKTPMRRSSLGAQP